MKWTIESVELNCQGSTMRMREKKDVLTWLLQAHSKSGLLIVSTIDNKVERWDGEERGMEHHLGVINERLSRTNNVLLVMTLLHMSHSHQLSTLHSDISGLRQSMVSVYSMLLDICGDVQLIANNNSSETRKKPNATKKGPTLPLEVVDPIGLRECLTAVEQRLAYQQKLGILLAQQVRVLK